MKMRKLGTALLLALAACAGEKENIDITKPITGDAATNAEKAYRRGMQERGNATYLEAVRYFQWVKNNFPYSQYASLSELALADLSFDRDEWAPAATAYADFVKGHPSHPKAPYAAFRIGVANYNDRGSEWGLLPPSYEKDQGPVKQALEALQKFLLGYPTSEYIPEARRLVSECRLRLARHERYVADFYFKREAWKGAAGRYLVVADQYGDLDDGKLRGEALWGAAQSFRGAGDGALEKEALGRLVAEAPGDAHRPAAETRLRELARAVPPPAAKNQEGAATAPGEKAPQQAPASGEAPGEKPPGPATQPPGTDAAPGVPVSPPDQR